MAEPGKQPQPADAGNSAAATATAFLDEARDKIAAGDAPAALICLKTVGGLAGCPPELRTEAAKMLAQAGATEAAIAAYLDAGNSYLNAAKDIPKARQAFQAGHALDVHNLDVVYMLGQADVADSRLQDGLAKFIDVLRKSNLKHVPALFAAGCIYQLNGQFDQAMLAFKKVLDREKEHVQATVRIGQLYQSKEQMADAIGYYIQASQMARESKHWGTARQIASMVQAIDPQNQKARMILDELDEQGHDAQGAGSDPVLTAAETATPVPAQKHGQPPGQKAAAPAPAPVDRPVAAPPPVSTQKSDAAPKAQQREAPRPAQSQSDRPMQPSPAKPVSQPPPMVAQVAAKSSPVKPAEAPRAAAQAAQAPHAAQAAPATSQAAAPPSAPTPAPAELERARQMLAAIEAQRQAAQQDLQLLLQTREELQKALSEQRTILETATMRKNDLDGQMNAAQASLEQARAAHSAAVAQGGDDQNKVKSLAADRSALESAITALRTEADDLAKRKGADETTVRELAARRDKIAGERDKIAGEVEALTAKMQDAKKLTDELEAIRAATGTAEDEHAAKAHTISEELASLEARRDACIADIGAAEAALANAQAQLAQAQKQAVEAEADRERTRAEAEAARERAQAEAETLRERAQAEAEARQRAQAEAEAARERAQAEADTLSQRVETLAATLKELEQRAAAAPAANAATPASVQANVGPQGTHARAAAHLAAGEWDKAIEAYGLALRTNPQDAAAAYQAGSLLAEHGDDLAGAERLLTQAAELRPEHAATRYQLSLVKARRGNVIDGAEMLTALARADANNGDFVDQFVERMEKDASSGDLLSKYRLGIAYRELGRVEEALVTLQAIQHETDMVVPCLIAIGSCLRRQGLDGAAAKRFAKAIETPGYNETLYLDALYNLGDLYEAKGTQESLALALSSFEELYARDCTYRDIGERVRVVKTNLGSTERQKVKRLPTRMADQGNQ